MIYFICTKVFLFWINVGGIMKKNIKTTEKDLKNVKSVNVKKKEQKKKKENIFKLIGKYFNGVVKEIKRIRWTSGKELFKYSLATVVFIYYL